MIGIIRYPGSNCDYDSLRYFKNSFFIWHNETKYPENLDLLVIPGGFAFGDRLYTKATGDYAISPGTMATSSPVTSIIREAAKQKVPIIGICNGFQILTQLGLLPGKLSLNKAGKFISKRVTLDIDYTSDNYNYNGSTDMYIANSYGRYTISKEHYEMYNKRKQFFMRYVNDIDDMDSYENVAGVCNEDRTIFGMMPHPERNNPEFYDTLYKILTQSILERNTKSGFEIFEESINNLMTSEHISYKSTKKYLKKLHTEENWVVQGPGENAGIVDIGNGYCIALRIESHNHPTFINAFEGAATGVGGIMRDIFTMGARPIAILDFLRFGVDSNSDKLLSEAINGISYYGNCVGVPNVGGDLYRDERYNKNPLVNVGCVGIVKKENIIYGNAKETNTFLVYIGSKTGNEGINGAAMASKSFEKDVDVKEMDKNVQRADPFLEKLLLEACCEIAEKKLADGMQDLGAGGLLCASYELISRGRDKTNQNLGCKINLDKIPTKYEMDPCNILISETQERMLMVCNEENIIKVFDILKKWDLEYAEIGVVNNSGKYEIFNTEMTKINNNGRYYVYEKKNMLYSREMTILKDINQDWELKNNDTNSKSLEKIKNKYLWQQYDSTVGNRTLKGPDFDGSYSILDIYEIGKKIVLVWDADCQVCYDKIIQLNAFPLCLVNCLNFGHPKDVMGDFKEVVENMNKFCKEFKVPVVGGNVSLYNSTDNVNIPSTPVILMLGIIN